MRTWTVLALVVASLAACLPHQAVAAAMQAIGSGEAPPDARGERRDKFEQETPRLLGLSAMKIEAENGDGDGGEEEENLGPLAGWGSPGDLRKEIARPGGAITRRAEHSPESLQDRTTVRRC